MLSSLRRQVPDGHALKNTIKSLAPGLLLAVTVAAAATFLASHYAAPQMLFALLLGIAFHFLATDPKCQPGIEFAAKKVLRFGVALLGLRITVEEMMSLGWELLAWVAAGVALTISIGMLIAKLFGRRVQFGMLTGGAVAICGASAALAISAVLPKHKYSERNTLFTVIAVTAFSTIAMIIYPILVNVLGFDDRLAGIFLGGTIHDVAQVVGAGYSISPQAGEYATITKLLRVALLVPVILLLSLYFRSHPDKDCEKADIPLLPFFVIGFCVCVAINSTHILPAGVTSSLSSLSSWCLVSAVAALGIKTSVKKLFTIGYEPILMVVIETFAIAAWVLLGIYLIG
ncbi:putative sulfate exporter family transporter [Enterovibrio sp. ZSDZ35]|uniref:Sulfate exporter family transporter n=1 Tax=Enterovibrio qingdaonensis TaxID=2899818 RepID=A0ABT5QG66_9GAMM|nr:putative sulfate exporter family transporter [Enterovibrio sp. ZSDZ35]MDD1779964.1 putative sulfate exporter family transporter [Enterovibrio sp. ZSDZ35]